MTHEEKELSYFQDKFHCSQSVLAAYAEELGLTEEQALKIAYCLNSCNISTVEGVQYAIEHKCFTEVCPKMVASAVRILEDME